MEQAVAPDLKAVKARQQATWSSGNFAVVAATLPIVSEGLCEAAELPAGARVLDVATGNGNTALAAARRWCDVTGIDYVPALIEHARVRAAAEGFAIDFEEGDAENLRFADGSFDAVLSTYGVMFAPDQPRAAAELLRVCRPGGTIGLANWTPDGFIGQLLKLTGGYAPPPAGVKSPVLWGTEARLRELFGDGVAELRTAVHQFVFRYRSPEHFVDVFLTYYGPTLKAHESLDGERRAKYRADLTALVERHNRAGDGTVAVPSDYLEVVATRR